MAQIVSGQSGYLGGDTGGTGSGVGAVIFDKPDDSGANMLFQSIQNNANYLRQAQAAKQKDNKEKQLAMLQGIDLDTKGVFEDDLPYFQEETKKIVNQYSDILNRYGGDLSSNAAMVDLNKLKGEQARLKLLAEQSAADKSFFTDVNKRLVDQPTKYDAEKSISNINNVWRKAKLGERAGGQTLVERTPILIEMMDKGMKDVLAYPDVTTTKIMTDPNTGKTYTQETKGVSPERVRGSMGVIYQSNRDVQATASEQFKQLPDDEQQRYYAEKAMLGKDDVPVEQLFVEDLAEKKYVYNQERKKVSGDNLFTKDGLLRSRMILASGLKTQEQESAIYKMNVALARGEKTEGAVEVSVPTLNGVEKMEFNPVNQKGAPFSLSGMDKPIQNMFIGTIVRDGVVDGKPVKFVYKVDTKSLLDNGIITSNAINKETGVLNMSGLDNALRAKIFQNIDKFPRYTEPDAISISKLNGATDKTIEATNKVYNAYTAGGLVDFSKINPRKEEKDVTKGKFEANTKQGGNKWSQYKRQ